VAKKKSKGGGAGRNMTITVDGDTLTIVVDLSKELGDSKSGKTVLIASSGGNKVVRDDIKMGLNVFRKK
jgi:hypothetical protein